MMTEETKSFLITRVLLSESDVLPASAEKVLQQIRREKPDNPVIYMSSGTSSIIAGSEKTAVAIKAYIDENGLAADLLRLAVPDLQTSNLLSVCIFPVRINCFSGT